MAKKILVQLEEDVHRKLAMFKAFKGCKTHSNAIKSLLANYELEE